MKEDLTALEQSRRYIICLQIADVFPHFKKYEFLYSTEELNSICIFVRNLTHSKIHQTGLSHTKAENEVRKDIINWIFGWDNI